MKTYLFLLLTCFLALSCSREEIDKKYAISEIRKARRFPYHESTKILPSYLIDHSTEGNSAVALIGDRDGKDVYSGDEAKLKKWAEAGLLILDEKTEREVTNSWPLGRSVNTWTTVKVTVTEKGAPYVKTLTTGGDIFSLEPRSTKLEIYLFDFDVVKILNVEDIKGTDDIRVTYRIDMVRKSPFGKIESSKSHGEDQSSIFTFRDGKYYIDLDKHYD